LEHAASTAFFVPVAPTVTLVILSRVDGEGSRTRGVRHAI
jgi:hypothetical protein